MPSPKGERGTDKTRNDPEGQADKRGRIKEKGEKRRFGKKSWGERGWEDYVRSSLKGKPSRKKGAPWKKGKGDHVREGKKGLCPRYGQKTAHKGRGWGRTTFQGREGMHQGINARNSLFKGFPSKERGGES